MRLKSEIWVKAYLRRCQHEGADAVLVRRGDTDAGAIYIKVSRLDGTAALFGPAPAGLDEAREDRRWQMCLEREADAREQKPTPISRARSTSIPTSGSWPWRIARAAISSRTGWPLRPRLDCGAAHCGSATGPLPSIEINFPLTPVAVKCNDSP